MIQPGILAEDHAGPVAAVLIAPVVTEQGQLLALPPGVLHPGDLRADALQLLAQRRNLRVHPRLVELADTAQLPLHQLQAGCGKSPVVCGHTFLLEFVA